MFTEYEYLEKLRDFLLTYHYPAPYDDLAIDYGKIMEQRGADKDSRGAALVNAGDIITSTDTDILGGVILNKRINYSLIMWRDTDDNEFRLEISNFINRFINWINEQNALRNTPIKNPALPVFSNTDELEETISADGGIQTAQIDKTRSEFSIGIHIDYKIEHIKESF